MGADGAWGALDREAQLSWLEWIEKSGSFRRANMYDLANKILEGHTRPQQPSRATRIIDGLLDLFSR
jgi:hypothetical protein